MTNVAHAQKTPRNRLPVLCSECRSYTEVKGYPARASCTCLREYAIQKDSFPLIVKLLNAGTDLTVSREARNGLRRIVEREEQRAREERSCRAFRHALYGAFERGEGHRRDLEIADALLGEGRRLTVDQITARWPVSVDQVKDLRDRLLRALETPVRTTTVRARRAA